MGWGAWGYCLHRGNFDMPHANGAGSIALHATDALRFGYCLLHDGRWKDEQLVPADYIKLCHNPSPYNPHCPFSLQFEHNADGHVAGAPRDAFYKSGAGGFGIFVVPSLDVVIYKLGGNNGQYDPALTGIPLTFEPDTSRDNWKPIPRTPFNEGSLGGRRWLATGVGNGFGCGNGLRCATGLFALTLLSHRLGYNGVPSKLCSTIRAICLIPLRRKVQNWNYGTDLQHGLEMRCKPPLRKHVGGTTGVLKPSTFCSGWLPKTAAWLRPCYTTWGYIRPRSRCGSRPRCRGKTPNQSKDGLHSLVLPKTWLNLRSKKLET